MIDGTSEGRGKSTPEENRLIRLVVEALHQPIPSALAAADVLSAAVRWANSGYLDEREIMAAVAKYREGK